MMPSPFATPLGQDLTYRFLVDGSTFHFKVEVGNGHTGRIVVTIAGKAWGPAQDALVGDGGAIEPLRDRVLQVTADESQRTQGGPLLTVTIWQTHPLFGKHTERVFTATGTFDAAGLCRLDPGVLCL
jgi:hypothetical protein